MKKLLFTFLVIGSSALLSGCSAAQESINEGMNEAKEILEVSPTPSSSLAPELQSSIERTNIEGDINQAERMFSELQEQYQLAKSQNEKELDGIWITNWNKQLQELAAEYQGYVLNQNDQYGQAKMSFSVALADLNTLWREYESSLQGKNHQISEFEMSVQEELTNARTGLQGAE